MEVVEQSSITLSIGGEVQQATGGTGSKIALCFDQVQNIEILNFWARLVPYLRTCIWC